ncbi:hypothetical protein KR51_00019180 [Rubidibacter lacunae KORDI 51-2]|uniref:Uncharacterized protein n=1 Tax=Rubidibacter lacunae KORDI 51-2 TaxID=582515 RepID=U5DI52_9CHRO|nr:hypothetical protein KR51_00019180 [Rubidibacter lacunae KORDI 51-2]
MRLRASVLWVARKAALLADPSRRPLPEGSANQYLYIYDDRLPQFVNDRLPVFLGEILSTCDRLVVGKEPERSRRASSPARFPPHSSFAVCGSAIDCSFVGGGRRWTVARRSLLSPRTPHSRSVGSRSPARSLLSRRSSLRPKVRKIAHIRVLFLFPGGSAPSGTKRREWGEVGGQGSTHGCPFFHLMQIVKIFSQQGFQLLIPIT